MANDIELLSMSQLEAINRLTRDLAASSDSLALSEARYLVDAYYSIQQYRIIAQNQVRTLRASGEPHEVVSWLLAQMETIEKQTARALDRWTRTRTEGVWARSIPGIGPVLAAGLMAHINIEHSPTVGKLWAFAGLDPTREWSKGQKRPWNARLKTLCWKIGESFVKVSGRDNDIYGKVYLERKAQEQERNERGEYADQAAAKLARFNIGRDTDAYAYYSQGKLPPAHIHARAKRYAVKLFLSHYHHVAWETQMGEPPVKPYIIEHGGHIDFVAPPNWPLPTQ